MPFYVSSGNASKRVKPGKEFPVGSGENAVAVLLVPDKNPDRIIVRPMNASVVESGFGFKQNTAEEAMKEKEGCVIFNPERKIRVVVFYISDAAKSKTPGDTDPELINKKIS